MLANGAQKVIGRKSHFMLYYLLPTHERRWTKCFIWTKIQKLLWKTAWPQASVYNMLRHAEALLNQVPAGSRGAEMPYLALPCSRFLCSLAFDHGAVNLRAY